MNLNQLKRPVRARIDQPSRLQRHHDLDGKYCIAMLDPADKTGTSVRIYFTEGAVVSMLIDPICLTKMES